MQFNLADSTLHLTGMWDKFSSPDLEKALNDYRLPELPALQIDGQAITHMDTAGALSLKHFINRCKASDMNILFINFSEAHQHLLSLIDSHPVPTDTYKAPSGQMVKQLGRSTVEKIRLGISLLDFLGELTMRAIRLTMHVHEFRVKPLLYQIQECGYRALPIIAVLSILIGVVLTYQMGIQLKLYGANIFVVDLLGMSVLREFAPLITAILVSGRTGSAFTAQLGMMKINEEIDALSVIGVQPFDILVIPRVLALLITLPLLTVWADVFGILGGMLMAKSMLHISMTDFLQRFQQSIGLTPYLVGLSKTPVFALLIAVVGCFRGLQVQRNADSVGKQTTYSVVQSIFLIIVADALFSVLFSWHGV